MKFKTPYNCDNFVSGEDYTDVKSCTQPDQVMPLKRILEGIKNGSIILPSTPQHYDIPEHDIDVAPGQTPEQTNANINAATSADLAESADNFGVDITAAPGFVPEDAQALTDGIEAILANAESNGEQSPQTQNAGDDKPKDEALDATGASQPVE